MESRAQLQERTDAALHPHRALGWLEHASQQAEQSALARAVRSDNTHRLARLYGHGDVAERPELVVPALAAQHGEQ